MRIRSARVLAVVASLTVLAACAVALPGAAFAAGAYRVVNIRPNDTLNIRSGPSTAYPVLGEAPPNAGGLIELGPCLQGWCNIQYGTVIGWVSGKFIAVDPNPSAAPPPRPVGPAATASASHILPDGTLETRYSDGRIRRRFPDGRTVTILPDGREQTYAYINVQSAIPPPLPPAYANWERSLSDRLLTVLGNVLTPAEMSAYMPTEAGKNPIDLIDWRLESVQFLTRPNS